MNKKRAFVAVLALASTSAFVTPTASATTGAQDRYALTPGSTHCVKYSQGDVWQTRFAWVRARYRLCMPVSIDGDTVQPIVQLQFDWPINCSLSVGFPPAGSVGCPLGVQAKEPRVNFRNFVKVNGRPVAIRIPLSITHPNGKTYLAWCNYTSSGNPLGVNIRQNGGQTTYTCRGPKFTRMSGVYTVGSPGPQADVADDGDTERILTSGAVEYTST